MQPPVPVFYKRRKGATLTLVAVCTVIVIAIGICFFLLLKIFGGGRELANADDAGTLNVAKQAILQPSKDALSFNNNDIKTNFAVYGDPDRMLSLINYNRLVAHAAIVAFNARQEGSRDAARNARKVWDALNEVAAFLRRELEDIDYANLHFDAIAGANSSKMLGGNKISVRDYGVSYMKRGGSTNLTVDPAILEVTGAASLLPVNLSGQKSPDGLSYMSGYTPFSVQLMATGDVLTYCGVPVGPQDRPHLVRYGDFESNQKDDFIQGKGMPAYPEDVLPPNSFKVQCQSRENTSRTMAGAVAAAIVGCHDRSYPMRMDYGYLEIKNGPSMGNRPNGRLSLEGEDVFCHHLASQGIAITGTDPHHDYIAKANRVRDVKELSMNASQGVENALNQINADVEERSMIEEWVAYNEGRKNHHPNINKSQEEIFHADGSRMSEGDLFSLRKKTYMVCRWPDYDDHAPPEKDACKQLINAFKRAWREYGSFDRNPNIQDNGFTVLEALKCDIISSRDGCKGCTPVRPANAKSGVKWFDHAMKYPAPHIDGKHPYNFGVTKSPYEYLEMIDQVPASQACARSSVLDRVLQRCREISPQATRDEIIGALKSKELPLGSTLYLYKMNGRLGLHSNPPSWIVPNTSADGDTARMACGGDYDVIGKFVNVSSEPPSGPLKGDDVHGNRVDPETDGLYPGWNYREAPRTNCMDQAIWVPSSGYNQLLGVLEFNNSCSGGGRFCQPN